MVVDRHGFAPCSPACEASDLLNGRAAQRWQRGPGSNRRMTAYDAAALPLGHPAVENVARRLGAAPNRKGLETALRMLVP